MTEIGAMVLVFIIVIACLIIAGYARYQRVKAFDDLIDVLRKEKEATDD